MNHPICLIIAGPNGAGKTTFANEYLPKEAHCLNFVNADLIASGLSPFRPESADIKSGRLMLEQIEAYAQKRVPVSFETTLSSRNYIKHIRKWREFGYFVLIYFLGLPSFDIAINRVELRVSQGGHNIPHATIIRRFKRGIHNFEDHYKKETDMWILFDNSKNIPTIIDIGTKTSG